MPGSIAVPTPTGTQYMSLEDARAYAQAHPDQAVSPDLQRDLHDPRVQQAIRSGATTDVNVGPRTFRIQNGQLTHINQGSFWIPVTAALLTAAGGYGLGQALGGTTAAALGPSTPESMAATQTALQNIYSGATVPPSLAPPPSSIGSWLSGLGKNLSSPLAIAGLAGAGANIYAAHTQSAAADKAAEAQLQAAREAIAYEKQRDQYLFGLDASRYKDVQGAVNPYIANGQAAGSSIMASLGLSPATLPTSTPSPVPNYTSGTGLTYATRTGLDTSQPAVGVAVPKQTQYPTNGQPAGTAQPRSNTQTVKMIAPNGQTGYVAPEDVNHYLQLGGRLG